MYGLANELCDSCYCLDLNLSTGVLYTGMGMGSGLVQGYFVENFKDVWVAAQFSCKSCLLTC